MSPLIKINLLDLRINQLRIELIEITRRINASIGRDKRAIFSAEYRQLKWEYAVKKNQISAIREQKEQILSVYFYLRSA